MTELLDALLAHRGLVCAVGAGGKKTTLARLFRAHPGHVAYTASCFTMPFPDDLDATVILGEQEAVSAAVLAASRHSRRLAFAGPPVKKGRLAGLDARRLSELHHSAGFDATFVKADGARTRSIKAPGEGEPNLPPGTDTVIFVVSAGVLGQPLDERLAHRVQRLAEVAGLSPGDTLECEHLAALLSSVEGAGKSVGNARLVGLVNQVDDEARLRQAREVARLAMAATGALDRVVIAAMRSEQAVLDVVVRSPC